MLELQDQQEQWINDITKQCDYLSSATRLITLLDAAVPRLLAWANAPAAILPAVSCRWHGFVPSPTVLQIRTMQTLLESGLVAALATCGSVLKQESHACTSDEGMLAWVASLSAFKHLRTSIQVSSHHHRCFADL